MASAELSRRVGKVVGYPPLSEISDLQRREFHEALLDADSFEDLPGKWQAAILESEENRPDLSSATASAGSPSCERKLLESLHDRFTNFRPCDQFTVKPHAPRRTVILGLFGTFIALNTCA
jgi:hypothetical protein